MNSNKKSETIKNQQNQQNQQNDYWKGENHPFKNLMQHKK
jgi:hypothetical protein